MSNNIDDKKVKVKKRKKEEMSIEDFCKKNNIKLKIDISYEESPEKEIPNKKILFHIEALKEIQIII